MADRMACAKQHFLWPTDKDGWYPKTRNNYYGTNDNE